MNKLDKIRQLKKDVEYYNPFTGATALDILDDILSIMEEDAKDMYVKVKEEPCCEKFDTCEKACVPKADYFKNNQRAELNKLALSILKESFQKDEDYLDVWLANVEMVLYDSVFVDFSDKKARNNVAMYLMECLFGVSK